MYLVKPGTGLLVARLLFLFLTEYKNNNGSYIMETAHVEKCLLYHIE